MASSSSQDRQSIAESEWLAALADASAGGSPRLFLRPDLRSGIRATSAEVAIVLRRTSAWVVRKFREENWILP